MTKNVMIAYCGLACSKCEAYIATVNNDDALRAEVARKWSEMNNVEIPQEAINCEGCRAGGIKTYFCTDLCEIRKCAEKKELDTCASCASALSCAKLAEILENSEDARATINNSIETI